MEQHLQVGCHCDPLHGSRFGSRPSSSPSAAIASLSPVTLATSANAAQNERHGVVVAASVAEHKLEGIILRILPPGVLVGAAVGRDPAELQQHGRDREAAGSFWLAMSSVAGRTHAVAVRAAMPSAAGSAMASRIACSRTSDEGKTGSAS